MPIELLNDAGPMPDSWLVQAVTMAWMFVFGACIGSFLNVVVYRLPLGLSLVYPGSRCPVCGHDIRWHDNVPVLGWLMLRGRCRDCGGAIAARYPLVEFLLAALFALLAWRELISGGANLPPRFALHMDSNLELFLLVAYHATLMTSLVAIALMVRDGHRTPFGAWAGVVLFGCALPLVYPEFRPVHYEWVSLVAPATSDIAVKDGLLGIGVGALLGVTAWPAWDEEDRKHGAPTTALASLMLVGAFCGWQATCAIAICTTLFAGLVAGLIRIITKKRLARPVVWSGTLAAVTIAWLLAWQPLAEFPPIDWAGHQGFFVFLAVPFVLIASLISSGGHTRHDHKHHGH